jgi:ribonucleoside-diphosphate reductase alpha chain
MNMNKNTQPEQDLYVIKRDGTREVVSFDKILRRVKNLGMKSPPLTTINFSQMVIKVIDQLYNDIPTHVIDELTAETCAALCTKHLEYGTLASRIIISNNHKNTPTSFSDAIDILASPNTTIIEKEFYNVVKNNSKKINEMIDYERDYELDYFGFKTLERAYLMRLDKKIIERPQHMWMRVAVAIHKTDLDAVKETYDMMSKKYFTHATPTLFNAGTTHQQLSSCYLLGMEEDSIDGIYNTLKDCAKISKWAGGIGLHIHNVRATGSHINGTNGTSNGIVPMLRVFNSTARYVDQGGGKRNGSIAIYLEPWHADIEDFLSLKKNHGDEEMRARDLFYGLWIPSLFMERVKNDGKWSLFCPHKCPGLADCYGEKFNILYNYYEKNGKANKTIQARDLWYKILDSQMETGTPYLLYKDPANEKSNQQNLGVIKSSNLCTEIIEYSDKNQTAVCNLASIALNKFVVFREEHAYENNGGEIIFDYDKLHEVTKIVTKNLNKIIDMNFYPTEKTNTSNKLHRPIGIGVQGLADVFALMDIPFHSDEARVINKNIFETMYHASLECSNTLSQQRLNCMITLRTLKAKGVESSDLYSSLYKSVNPLKQELIDLKNDHLGSYSSFENTPTSRGILQFDMWNVDPTNERYNWSLLKENILTYGLRNSLLIAPMPTASTSQILGNNECFEPFTSNIYSRRTNAGEFVIVNKYLMTELISLGLWNEDMKNNIILNKGSIQHIESIPLKMREKYKIVWEIPMKHIIDMAADRAPFICQSQSMNLWMEDPDYKSLTSMHFYAWQKGLKTGMYYLRRKAKHQPQQFTIAPPNNNASSSSSMQDKNSNNENFECETCSA